MIIEHELYRSAKNGKARAGKTDLLKHLTGEKLPKYKAIRAKCYDCNGMGESSECDMVGCPLYPHSPYRNATEAPHSKLTEE